MTGLRYRLASVAALAVLLTGCTGIDTLNRAAQPNDLYALTPKSTFSANLPRISRQIVVEEPTATAAVDTNQIVVQPTPLQVQYLPGARWVDRAPLIVQALLIESFENSGRVAAVGRSSVALRADYVVVTDVREFQAFVPQDAAADGALRVVVGLNLKIVSEEDDLIIASRSFEEVVAASSDSAGDLALAFDEALGDVMRDAVEWSIRRIHDDATAREREREAEMAILPVEPLPEPLADPLPVPE